jgi:hypothetical protein
MLQIHTSDIKYRKIQPIVLGSLGLQSGSIKSKLSEYRELDLTINQNLNHTYNYLRDNAESKLILNIDNTQIGFFKGANIITHLLVIGDIGAGSDGNSIIVLDNLNANFLIEGFLLDENEFEIVQNKKAYYIKNQFAGKYSQKYYEIKVISSQTNSENNTGTPDSLEAVKNKIYSQAINFLKENNDKISIQEQINRQNGSSDIHMYSSVLEIKKNKRLVSMNLAYNGSAINLLNQLSPNFTFVHLTNDKTITIQTGVIDNYDLVNEICSKAGWQWREKDINVLGITTIEVGNFNELSPVGLANNIIQDNWFKKQKYGIKQIRELFPTLDIDLQINKWTDEGSKLDVRYIENIKNQYGIKINSFDIKTTKIFQGYINSIDLFNFL